MALITKKSLQFITADTNDILSGNSALQSGGPGLYRITPLAAAAADATFTVNDGNANVVDAQPIPVKAAAVTFPAFDRGSDQFWIVRLVRGERLLVDVTDGTNAEIAIVVEKIG